MKAVTEDLIRAKAYELWEQSGRPAGLELEHWLLAERTLTEQAPDTGEALAVATPAKARVSRVRKPAGRSRRREMTI